MPDASTLSHGCCCTRDSMLNPPSEERTIPRGVDVEANIFLERCHILPGTTDYNVNEGAPSKRLHPLFLITTDQQPQNTQIHPTKIEVSPRIVRGNAL